MRPDAPLQGWVADLPQRCEGCGQEFIVQFSAHAATDPKTMTAMHQLAVAVARRMGDGRLLCSTCNPPPPPPLRRMPYVRPTQENS
jgi:hypothetical protein